LGDLDNFDNPDILREKEAALTRINRELAYVDECVGTYTSPSASLHLGEDFPQNARITMQEALPIFFYASLLVVSGLFCNFIVPKLLSAKRRPECEPRRSHVLESELDKMTASGIRIA
jgi:hypothetical protein